MHSNAGILNYLSLSDIQVISLNSIDRKKNPKALFVFMGI